MGAGIRKEDARAIISACIYYRQGVARPTMKSCFPSRKCSSSLHTYASSVACRCVKRTGQTWSGGTSGKNVAVLKQCIFGSMNSMMMPCLPTCQSSLHVVQKKEVGRQSKSFFTCIKENQEDVRRC